MTNSETKIAEAFKKCGTARLPDGFSDRLVKRIHDSAESELRKKKPFRTVFTRIALIAASLTLLLGFVPNVLDDSSDCRNKEIVAHFDEIRPASHTLPQNAQLNALAFLGFCREVIRRRIRPLLDRSRKREDED